jgi:cyanophycin synthetase
VVVERFIAGTQYRVLVVGDTAVAASGGEAEQVLADGIHTVEQLVAKANQDPKRGEDSALPLTPLVLDEISLELLRRQGLDNTSVPEVGRTVLIHHNGDLTVDETDRMHPDIAADCVVAAQTVGLDVAGIDLIAADIGRPLEEQGGAVIEVNASPGLVMHLKPLVGRPRPVGEAIVNHLFPVGESGRVPLVAIAGGTGKTVVTSAIASMLTAASHTVGEASSRGLRIGSRVLSGHDCADAASARRVLVNPFVDAIVLESDARKVIQEGLAFDRCDVAVVTDLAAQAPAGEDAEGDRGLVAKAIRAPVDVVLPEGCAILNADEPEVAAMAEKCRGRVILFARDGQSAPIREHLAKGGQAVFVAEGVIVAAQMDQSLPMFDLAVVAGRPLVTSAEALLAAVGAGVALKLTQTAVSQGVSAALGLLAKTP